MKQHITLVINKKDEVEIKEKVNGISATYGNILLFSDTEQVIKITLYNAPLDELLSLAIDYVKLQNSRRMEIYNLERNVYFEASRESVDEVVKTIDNAQMNNERNLIINLTENSN